MNYQALKGMKDVLPSESYTWQYAEDKIKEACKMHGFLEVRTPLLESSELFLRGVGKTTDIVQKEMYTFMDKGERYVTLKPEGTASVVRMFIEHKLYNEAQPTKMYYLSTPIFRYERPQAGRLREHHQFGVEIFGGALPSSDAECIMLALQIFETLGIHNLCVNINSIGCPECRPNYNEALKEYLNNNLDSLCETCNTRFETNPLRILDCKEENCKKICQNAPKITDYLCHDCNSHFLGLQTILTEMKTNFKINPYIVRGLDYYTKTVFEIVSNDIGAQDALCGGGRYDGLVKELGGPDMPAVGFGMGIERLLLLLSNKGIILPSDETTDVYIATIGEKAAAIGIKAAFDLRYYNIATEFDHIGRSIKAQMKYADKLGAKLVVIIGDDEIEKGVVKFKNMTTGMDSLASIDDISNTVRNMLEDEEEF
ncbi:MAG: histidine--tRNA ligase [Clostridia bacterium]